MGSFVFMHGWIEGVDHCADSYLHCYREDPKYLQYNYLHWKATLEGSLLLFFIICRDCSHYKFCQFINWLMFMFNDLAMSLGLVFIQYCGQVRW